MADDYLLASRGRIQAEESAVVTQPYAQHTQNCSIDRAEDKVRRTKSQTGQAYYPYNDADELKIVQGELLMERVTPLRGPSHYAMDKREPSVSVFPSLNGMHPAAPEDQFRVVGVAKNNGTLGVMTAAITSGPVTIGNGEDVMAANQRVMVCWPERSEVNGAWMPKVWLLSRSSKFLPQVKARQFNEKSALLDNINEELATLISKAINPSGNNASAPRVQLLDDWESLDFDAYVGKRPTYQSQTVAITEEIKKGFNFAKYSAYPAGMGAVELERICPIRKLVNLQLALLGCQIAESKYRFTPLPSDFDSADILRGGRKRARDEDGNDDNDDLATMKLNPFTANTFLTNIWDEQNKLWESMTIGHALSPAAPGQRLDLLLKSADNA